MGGRLLVLVLVAACGRVGFDPPQAAEAKPDAAPVIDADPTIDAPIGVGSYAIAESSSPYVTLEAAPVVPGFEAGSDDGLYELPLPFTFLYYGIPYTSISISTNGYATFGAPVANIDSYTNDCPLDATTPDALIAVFWDDLFASSATAPLGTIRYTTAPGRVDIEWRDLDAYYHAGAGQNSFSQGIRVTHTLVLHDTGVIEMHYGPRTGSSTNKDCGVDRHRGCSATIGLRAPSSSVIQPVQCGTEIGPQDPYTAITEGRLITFTPR